MTTYGPPGNQWIHSKEGGYDLTRSVASPAPLSLETDKGIIKIAPHKSALIIIDMQNFFLHPELRAHGPGLAAKDVLLSTVIPAARASGVRILWVNWGLTDEEVNSMPPCHASSFGAIPRAGSNSLVTGFGSEMGMIDGVDAGKLLFRDTWNADLYGDLKGAWEEGKEGTDVWIHKNRMSAMWGKGTALEMYLEKEGITTLFFTGVNSDQCVMGTLVDSHSKGYDTIYLKDAAATTSPEGAKIATEYNSGILGFVSDSTMFAKGLLA